MENERNDYTTNKWYYDRLLLGIRNRQEELGLTNKMVANILNIRCDNYERLIKGKFICSVLQLIRVCQALNLNLCVYPEEDVYDEDEQDEAKEFFKDLNTAYLDAKEKIS